MPDKARYFARINPPLRHTIQACRDGKSPWPLFLYGDVGCGKTCAALSVADTCRWSVVFTLRQVCEKKGQAMRGELYSKNPQAPNRVTEADMMDYLIRCDLLVLDEIGARDEVSNAETDVLHTLLSGREGRPMILTSNRKPDDLKALYGAAVVSRILAGTTVEVVGPDKRLA